MAISTSALASARTGFGDVKTIVDAMLAGFQWTSYSGSISYGTGSGTWTSITTTYASYCQIEDLVFVRIKALGTTGTTPSYLTASTPVTLVDGQSISAPAHDGGSIPEGGTITVSGSDFLLYVYDKVAFGNGTLRGFNFTGIFTAS